MERLRSLVMMLFLVGLFFAAPAALTGCSDESQGKSCTTINDCGPCQFCNMGVCRDEANCTPCDTDADCQNDEYCDVALSRCRPRTTDGDLEQDIDDNSTDTVVDNPTEQEDSTSDGDISTEEEGQVTDGDETEADIDPDIDIDLGEVDINEFESIVSCDRSGTAGPEISIIPSEESINFGAVMVGDFKVEYMTICNSGGESFAVTNIHLAHGTTTEFQLRYEPLPVELDPGTGLVVAVIYQPRDNNPDQGKIQILSSADRQEVEVTLIGSVKPVGRLQVRPEVLQFQNQGGTKVVALDNVGIAALSILKLEIKDNPDFRIIDPNTNGNEYMEQGPIAIAPGEFINLSISFSNSENAQDGVLDIYWHNGESDQHTQVPLQVGGAGLCAVPDAGPDQSVPPLATVQLDGTASYDPNDSRRGDEVWYKWDMVERPNGAFRAIIVDSAGNNIQGQWTTEGKPTFYAELAGRYVISLSINPHDDPGCNTVDTVTIMAVPDETIHIQLRWTTPGNDHDLHFVRYHMKSWDANRFGCFTRGDRNNQDDCHWQNCNTKNETATPCPPRGCPGPEHAPDWGSVGDRSDDPTLDIDDIPGTGPENINLSLPELGDYFVAVENYSGSDGPELTVKIWLFGVLQANFSGVRIPQSSYHWNVCWLHVITPTEIAIEPIGIIKPSGSGTNKDCAPTQQQ